MGLKQRETGTFYNLKIEKQKYPKFTLVGKDDDGAWVDKETSEAFEGMLQDMRIEEYDFEGETQRKLVMEFLNDKYEKEILSVNFNSLSLNILNTLAKEENLSNINLRLDVYSAKDKEGKVRPRIAIKINGEKGDWLIDGAKISKIYNNQDEWVKMFEKFIKPKFEIGVVERVEEEEEHPQIDEPDEVDSPPKETSKVVESPPDDIDDLPW